MSISFENCCTLFSSYGLAHQVKRVIHCIRINRSFFIFWNKFITFQALMSTSVVTLNIVNMDFMAQDSTWCPKKRATDHK